MTHAALYGICGVTLFTVAFCGAVVSRHLLRKVIAINLMGTSVFLVLIALASRTPDGRVDAVPQAMVLTGVVVALGSTALALGLVRRFYRETGRTDLPPPGQE